MGEQRRTGLHRPAQSGRVGGRVPDGDDHPMGSEGLDQLAGLRRLGTDRHQPHDRVQAGHPVQVRGHDRGRRVGPDPLTQERAFEVGAEDPRSAPTLRGLGDAGQGFGVAVERRGSPGSGTRP